MKTLGAMIAIAGLLCGAPASAAIFAFNVKLNGANEFPVNASTGHGFGVITFDDLLHTMTVDVDFADLLGNVTASHIHAATTTPFAGLAGVATQTPTFAGFPSGVRNGSYLHTFDMALASSYRAGYLAGFNGNTAAAEAALLGAAKGGQAYLNIHTTAVPSGEIRGFLTAVPEPATWGLMLLGFGTAGVMLRSRRRAVNLIG